MQPAIRNRQIQQGEQSHLWGLNPGPTVYKSGYSTNEIPPVLPDVLPESHDLANLSRTLTVLELFDLEQNPAFQIEPRPDAPERISLGEGSDGQAEERKTL
jgi:hypothetical protein